jgi:flavin reductase (DIM6/NTAB) family NADH-FMN oxidoreductase RutF
MEYSLNDIQQLPDRFRRNLINSLHGFKSVSLIGTCNLQGQTNLAIFSQIFHIGANPPLVGILVRPDSVDRHTLRNIRETSWFTINHIQESFVESAHQTSARYPEDVSEFDACGLTPINIPEIPAPFVAESAIRYALYKVDETILVNGTILITGEIRTMHVPDTIVSEDGFLQIHEAGTIASSGLDAYYRVEPISRFAYAKPDLPVVKIPFESKK